jgi:arylsulfatase A-like enzyme
MDDLEIYGGAARTPALRRLRDDGILFRDGYSVAYGTTPSHASLMTSLPALEHGVYDNRTLLRESLVTLAEVLREGGYATGAFVSALAVGAQLGFDQGFDVFEGTDSQRPGDVATSLALDWMREVHEPFFVWVHFYDPHQPYNPPPEYLERRPAEPVGQASSETEADFTQLVVAGPYLEAGPAAFDGVHREARRRYLAEIEFMDAQIGRILEDLVARSYYDRSLIAVVSDHGENFGEPDPELAFTHRGLHSGVVRLAAVMKLPRSRHASTTSSCLIGNLDFAPTWSNVLGLDAPSSWRGQDATACLEAGGDGFRDHLVLEGAHQIEWSVRTKTWAYRELRSPETPEDVRGNGYHPGERWKLYDLSKDPHELRSLGRIPDTPSEAFPERERFHRLLSEFAASSKIPEVQTLDDPEYLETLRALGYLN